MNELRLARGFGGLGIGMVEAMHPDLYRAVATHRIHLQRPWNELTAHFSADVLLSLLGHCLVASGQATLIVVELQIVGKERDELFHVAPIIGIEERIVERR